MRLEQSGRSLKIYLGERMVASHSPSAPMFATSDSLPEVRVRHGAWSAQGRTLPEMPLGRFEWDEQTHLLTFFSTRRRVSFELTERDGYVELRLADASPEIGRLAMHLYHGASAEVYGGGVTGARDLRGLDPLVWAGEGLSGGVRAAMRARAKRCSLGSAAPQSFFHTSDGFFAALDHAGGIAAQVARGGHVELEMWGLPDAICIGWEGDAEKRIAHTSLLGAKRTMPPRWAIEGTTVGVVGGEEELLRRVDRAVRAGLRPTAAYIRDWSGVTASGSPFEDYAASSALYPRMTDILSRLRSHGIRAIARVAPLLSPDGECFGEAMREGYLLTDASGAPALTDRGGMAAYLDLENPDARAWAVKKLRERVFGVGFAAVSAEDASCEPIDSMSCAGRAMLFHNRRAKRWLEVCEAAAAQRKGTVLAVSGAALGIAPLVTLSGDAVDWELGLGVKSLVEGLLGLASLGIAGAGCDIGARLASVPTQLRSQQLVRWAELAAFTPHFRLPAVAEAEPALDPSDRTLVDRMAKLHTLLAPLYAVLLDRWSKGGAAPIRHTLDAYPELAGKPLDAQFLVGRDLIVAPACDLERNSVEVTLPDGAWVHLMSGGDYTGGTHTVETLPGNPAAFFRRDGENATFFRSVMSELAE